MIRAQALELRVALALRATLVTREDAREVALPWKRGKGPPLEQGRPGGQRAQKSWPRKSREKQRLQQQRLLPLLALLLQPLLTPCNKGRKTHQQQQQQQLLNPCNKGDKTKQQQQQQLLLNPCNKGRKTKQQQQQQLLNPCNKGRKTQQQQSLNPCNKRKKRRKKKSGRQPLEKGLGQYKEEKLPKRGSSGRWKKIPCQKGSLQNPCKKGKRRKKEDLPAVQLAEGN